VTALSGRLYHGVHPGLPEPMTRVPFGRTSASRDEFRLLPAQLKVVTAIVAAEFVGLTPVSLSDIEQVVDCSARTMMAALERAGWVEVAGHLPRRTSKLYKPTAKAWRELGLVGWSLLKEVPSAA
jgi:chromosome segregation and condensation protein ScpB